DIEITIIATGFYDKRNQVQIATGGQKLTNHQTQSVAKAFNDMVAADRDRDERQQAPIAPPAPPAPPKAPARDTGYNANLFANRGAQREYNEVFATQPANTVAPPIAPVQPEVKHPDVVPSRIEVGKKEVPAFLRRLRRNDDENR
ncbi:MAG TPA: hypothetical protein VJZ69_02255, partial [Clostridia bacterium]|nr:hypothetical protein [Clostridia bacterium]